MRKPLALINPLICIFFVAVCATTSFAQEAAPKWTPEELKELFGYCDKPDLIKKWNISAETADKIAELDQWARVQLASVEANTNEAFATPNEVETELVKKYKALRLSGDQLKALNDRRQNGPMSGCPVTNLVGDRRFDTIPLARAIQLYKSLYRKQLIDKVVINGRMADMLIEAEVWKQKEAATIIQLPATDFNRVRKTVYLYDQRDKRYRAIGLTDQQVPTTLEFFETHTIFVKN